MAPQGPHKAVAEPPGPRDFQTGPTRGSSSAKVEARAPVGVNRGRAALPKVFNFGIQTDSVEVNPVTGTLTVLEKTRDRVLTPAEIKQFWTATEPREKTEKDPGITAMMAARFRLVLVTAQRGGEVNSMKWTDISENMWTIPAEHSKNGLAHRVPLSALALEILGTLPASTSSYSPELVGSANSARPWRSSGSRTSPAMISGGQPPPT